MNRRRYESIAVTYSLSFLYLRVLFNQRTTRRTDMLAALGKVDSGDGVVVLTDMFGGSPSNLAISAMEHPNVEVIAGVNLPMLVKLASVRGECGLDEAIGKAQEAGRKYISVASQILAAH